jgi:hypothetical protein
MAAIIALLLQRGKRQRVAVVAATTIRTVQTVRAAKCGFGLAKEKGAKAPFLKLYPKSDIGNLRLVEEDLGLQC